MNGNILVIGGYGQVGRHVCIELMKRYPKKVFAGGRNFQAGTAFSNETFGQVKPFRIDICNAADFGEIADNFSLIVMCLTPERPDFALFCIDRNINYIDISPSNDIPLKIKMYEKQANDFQAVCILGAGLAPGLSNLMVKNAVSYFDKVKTADIILMLGLGEKHGRDGIKWLLDNINKKFKFAAGDSIEIISTFGKKMIVDFLEIKNRKTAYAFDLADQHTIPLTLGIKHTSSYFCYDSAIITKLVVLMKKAGLFKMLKFRRVYNMFVDVFEIILKITKKFKLGSDIYSVKVEIQGINGSKNQKHQSLMIGYNNSSLTGKVVAITADRVMNGKLMRGIFYFEELFEFGYFYEHLKNDIDFKCYFSENN
ncbi:MAG TPA: hypothetical protein PLM72_11315 [Spirochaetota bacterium]|nr:hypothetical protein [Spirochaetota bacterium]